MGQPGDRRRLQGGPAMAQNGRRAFFRPLPATIQGGRQVTTGKFCPDRNQPQAQDSGSMVPIRLRGHDPGPAFPGPLPSLYSSGTSLPTPFLPQGLCTGCALCLGRSSPSYPQGSLHPSLCSGLLSDFALSKGASQPPPLPHPLTLLGGFGTTSSLSLHLTVLSSCLSLWDFTRLLHHCSGVPSKVPGTQWGLGP